MQSRATKQMSAEERYNIFCDEFNDGEWDAGWVLRQLVIAAGNYLCQIVGKESADAGMARMLQPLTSGDNPAAWREQLEEEMTDFAACWPLGELFLELAGYAYFGIVTPHDDSDSGVTVESHLEKMVQRATTFLDETPLEQWVPSRDDQRPLAELVMLVRNRWALDHGEPIEPQALALFGGISESRIRNLMAGSDRVLTVVDKKIPAQQALAWLADRDAFLDSIWREQYFSFGSVSEEALDQPLFVPVARDGSIFNPALDRGTGYKIGQKGAEQVMPDFNEAVAELQRMPIPYWRRPNRKGKDGIVRGVEWRRYDLKTLIALGV